MGYIGQAPANKAVKTADIEDSAITAAKIADGTVVAGDLASDSVTTAKILNANVTEAKIAADAVTLAKMASGTDGNIISYDASGNPVAIATGSDGEVLTSAGAGQPPAFEAAAGFDVTSITGQSELSAEPAMTDEYVISDAGTLKKLNFSRTTNMPVLQVRLSSGDPTAATQAIANDTATKIQLANAIVDTQSAFDTSTNYRYTPTISGYYWFGASITKSVPSGDKPWYLYFYKNGSSNYSASIQYNTAAARSSSFYASTVMLMNGSSDYVELFVLHNDLATTNVYDNVGYHFTGLHGFRLSGTGTVS